MKLRDTGRLRRKLVEWLAARIDESGMAGAVFGLSGGIDSAVVCGLAAEALGAERCLGLVMPIDSAAEDARLALEVADTFGVRALELELKKPFDALLSTLSSQRERALRTAGGAGDPAKMTAPIITESTDALARANLKPRLRMISLYYYANLLGYMVLGTGNRDEFTVGYFTKYGDGGADAFPLGDLVKAEVRALARDLGVPREIIERPPTAGLWSGQTDEAELGFSYDLLDRFVIEGSSGDADVDARIRERARLSVHKLEPAPVARPGG